MVHRQVEPHIHRIVERRGVAWGEGELDVGEDVHAVKVDKGLVHIGLVEEPAPPKLEVLEQHPWSDGDSFTLIGNLDAAQHEGIVVGVLPSLQSALSCLRTSHVLTDVGAHFAKIELPIGFFGNVLVGHHEQFHAIGNVGGVGKVADVVGTIVVVAVIAEVIDDAGFLVGEVEGGELPPLMDVGFLRCGFEDAVLNGVAKGIADAVEEIISIDVVVPCLSIAL